MVPNSDELGISLEVQGFSRSSSFTLQVVGEVHTSDPYYLVFFSKGLLFRFSVFVISFFNESLSVFLDYLGSLRPKTRPT